MSTTFYIDEPKTYRTRKGEWCHLWVDPGDEEALHGFAARIGIKPGWFQDKPGFPHYDITGRMIAEARRAGAMFFPLRAWVAENRRLQRASDTLNHVFRNGGDIIEDREYGRDCVSEMHLARSRPDVLANALRSMGVPFDDMGADDD